MAANHISNMVFSSHKNISVHFVVHHDGHATEAMGLAAQEILWHSAAETALHFLQQTHASKRSEILGIAYARGNGFLLSRGSRRYLCICTLNIGAHETLENLKQTAWHQVWQMIHRIQNFEKTGASNAVLDESNPNAHRTVGAFKEVMTITRNSLCADIFSGLICSYDGDTKALNDIAQMRIKNVLSKHVNGNPEYHPFPIAIDGAKTALEMFVSKSWPKKKIIAQAMKLAQNLGNVYDDEALKHWIVFAGNTQNMVWRNIPKRDILGAAIHMAGHTHTRLIAHQITEISQIIPSSFKDSTEFYNSYMINSMAEKIHEHITNDLFEKHLDRSLKAKSGQQLNDIADKQNEQLTNGEINGWCALALQYAAKAVDVGIKSGHNPEALARKEFESCRTKVTIENLRLFNRLIIQEKRKGTSVTMEKIIVICAAHDELKLIGQSIKATMAIEDQSSEKISA